MKSTIAGLIAVLAAGAGACSKQSLLDNNGHEAATLHAVDRPYARSAEEVWRAVVAATQELGLTTTPSEASSRPAAPTAIRWRSRPGAWTRGTAAWSST